MRYNHSAVNVEHTMATGSRGLLLIVAAYFVTSISEMIPVKRQDTTPPN